MTDTTPTSPTETPNVVVTDPAVRRKINIVLGLVGLVLSAVMVADGSSPAFDLSAVTIPAFAVYSFVAGAFGLGVTVPNIPKR